MNTGSTAAAAKRPRVALACTRCKARKQKCDGRVPGCGQCAAAAARCAYVVPAKPMPFGKNQYIKSLERRVAELETLLAGRGVAEVGTDHWGVSLSTASGASLSTASGVSGASGASSSELSSEWPGAGGAHDHRRRGSDPDPHAAVLEWQDGVDSVGSVLRSLSLDVNGQGYMGASSQVTLGRMFHFLDRGAGGGGPSRRRSSSSTTAGSGATPEATPVQPIDLADVPAAVADRLYGGYLKHIGTRFPVAHSVWLGAVHGRRQALADGSERTLLHLVYAVSGRFLETTGEAGPWAARRHYAAALQGLDAVLAGRDERTVQVLLLMAIYCLRDAAGPGVWTCSRMALLVAVDLGLHRQTQAAAHARSLDGELRKRLFWACYCFDRQISLPMGRPLGIADRDIDVALPLDMDEAATAAALAVMPLPARASPADPSTSLTSFVLLARLRRLESAIQETVYRVDGAAALDAPTLDGFLARLEQWRARIPHDARAAQDVPGCPYDGYAFYMVFYYKCQRLLLYPVLSDPAAPPRFLRACARACAGVCGAYKQLHQTMAVGYSYMALQNVFIAGLTLVYCIWLCPGDIFDLATSNGIHDCSIMLFVIAERVPAAAKYRNAFELIRQRVLDQVRVPGAAADHPGQPGPPRAALSGLTAALAPAVHAFEVDMPFEVGNGSFEQLSQIITDMSGGESFPAGLTQFQAQAQAEYEYGV